MDPARSAREGPLLDFILASMFVSAIGIGTQVFRSKILALVIGPNGVGLVAEVAQVVSFISAPVSALISTALVRWLADEEKDGTESRGIAYALGVAFPILMLGLVATPVLSHFFIPTHVTPHGTLYLVLYLLSFAFGAVQSAVQAYLVVHRAMRAVSLIAILAALQSTGVVVAATIWGGVTGQLAGMAGSALIGAFIALAVARRSHPHFHFIPKYSKAFAMSAVRMSAMWLLTAYCVNIRLAAARSGLQVKGGPDLGLAWNGNFQAALAIGETYIGLVLSGVHNYFIPRIARAENSKLGEEVKESVRASLVTAAPVLAMVVAFRLPLIILLYSSRFSEAATLLGYFAVADAARCVSAVMMSTLSMRIKIVPYVIAEIAATLLASLMTPLLIGRFGVTGAGMATIVYFGSLAFFSSGAVIYSLRINLPWRYLTYAAAAALGCFALDQSLKSVPWLRWCVVPAFLWFGRPTIMRILSKFARAKSS